MTLSTTTGFREGDPDLLKMLAVPTALTLALNKFISLDPQIIEVKRQLEYLALVTEENTLNILITGETGTGKELLASAIGSVSQGQFVAINCAALPADLIESELFGHKKGAFTSADTEKTGLIQTAQNGTCFLDEIGDMPLSAQAKLLRVLSTRRIRKVGSTQDELCTVNCRFVSATHRNLPEQIARSLFREDLYWRLAQWTFHIPPLRARLADIREIIHSIPGWEELDELELDALRFSDRPWSGNVRELHSVVTQMILGKRIESYHQSRAEHAQAKLHRNRV